MSSLTMFRARERGAILPLVAVTMVAVLALVALAMDSGLLERERRLAQNAADAGALAGAQEIFRNQVRDTILSSARQEVTRNGFTNALNHARVSVDSPTTGTYQGSKYVIVNVWDTVGTMFAGILGRSKSVVHASAIGGIVPPSGNCLVSLSPNAEQAIEIDGGGTVTAQSCGVQVNSSAPGTGTHAAFYLSGATLNATGGTISVTGSASTSGGTLIGATVQTGVTAAPDPLAYLTMPTFSHTCTFTDTTVSSGTVTLNPGTYCGGITIQGSSTVVTFASGDYYLLGGGLNIKSGASTRSDPAGSGTTFINTWDNTSPDHTYSRINIQSGSLNTLFANTGPGAALPGILIYQDPSAPSSFGHLPGGANEIQSGANSVFTGSIYFPTQDVNIHSGSGTVFNGGIVAQQEWIHGANVTFTAGGAGAAYFKLRRPSIVQ